MTQAELAGSRYSHAYVSVLEAGRRQASTEAMEYFAQRLGVRVEVIWGEAGATWAIEMARDLRQEGLADSAKDLLERTLGNLAQDKELHPRVLVALHRELAIVESVDPEASRRHLLKALELAGDDESLLAARGELHASLGEQLLQDDQRDEALDHYKHAARLLVDLVGRRFAPQ